MNFEQEFSVAVKDERHSMHTVVTMISECLRTQHYLIEGYPSVNKWLIRAHGYSESAANRRIQAARLLIEVPEVSERLLNGELTLTTMTQVQGTIRREEIRTGETLRWEIKKQLIEVVQNKTEAETDRALAASYPDAQPTAESLRAINAEDSKFTAVFDSELLTLIEKAKELCAEHSVTEVIRAALRDLVKRKDPTTPRKTRAAAGAVARIPASLRREVLARGCEYQNPVSKTRCGSHEEAEVDHLIGLALGGNNEPENLRCLCRKHNLLAAEVAYGAGHMKRWRRDPAVKH